MAIALPTLRTQLIITFLSLSIVAVLVTAILFELNFRQALSERTLAQLTSVKSIKSGLLNKIFEQENRKLHSYANNLFMDSVLQESHVLILENGGFLKGSKRLYTQLKSFKNPIRSLSPFYFLEERGIIIIDSTFLQSSQRICVEFIPNKTLEPILSVKAGFGATGETYLVDPTGLMITKSRFWPDKWPIQVKTEAFQHTLQQGETTELQADYRGVSVFSSGILLKNGIVLLSEIDEDEALQPIQNLRWKFYLLLFILILMIAVISKKLSDTLSDPLVQIKSKIIELSKGFIPAHKLNIKRYKEASEIDEALFILSENKRKRIEFATEIGKGNFKAAFELLSPHDELGKALIHMRDQLIVLQEALLAEHILKKKAIVQVQEDERKRISMDLHDHIGQLLTVVKLKAQIPEKTKEEQQALLHLIDKCIAELRHVSRNLMPSTLWEYGLEPALQQLIEDSPVPVTMHYIPLHKDQKLPFDVSLTLFRIVQEGLNNVYKHAQATLINLIIQHEKQQISVLIEDNGVGFQAESTHLSGVKKSNGLTNMRERVDILHGSIDIESNPLNGTAIYITIPLETTYENQNTSGR